MRYQIQLEDATTIDAVIFVVCHDDSVMRGLIEIKIAIKCQIARGDATNATSVSKCYNFRVEITLTFTRFIGGSVHSFSRRRGCRLGFGVVRASDDIF